MLDRIRIIHMACCCARRPAPMVKVSEQEAEPSGSSGTSPMHERAHEGNNMVHATVFHRRPDVDAHRALSRRKARRMLVAPLNLE